MRFRTRLELTLVLLTFAVGLGSNAWGQNSKFPYEAVVSGEDAFVRSGPGTTYYPTGRLPAGERVVVHRHDPGGWYMVAPPSGSFSWIPARQVDRDADGPVGVVNANRVPVRVGSFESDVRDVSQRQLDRGDTVQITGEKVFADARGESQVWYRIQPPRGEWRWMAGKNLSPVNRLSETSGRDPFPPEPGARPSGVTPVRRTVVTPEPVSPGDGSVRERPLVRRETREPAPAELEPAGPVGPAAPIANTDADLAEYDRLDAELQQMLKQSPASWDLTRLEQGFQSLRARIPYRSLQTLIDNRLSMIARESVNKAEYDDFRRITEETDRREAELAARMRGRGSLTGPALSAPAVGVATPSLAPVTTPVAVGGGVGTSSSPALVPVPMTSPLPASGPALGTPASSPGIPQGVTPVATTPRFDGAGIVRKAGGGANGPSYVLTSHEGRVLTFLVPEPGVSLEQWVGQSVGITGVRGYRPELNADLLVVKRLSPVRLMQ